MANPPKRCLGLGCAAGGRNMQIHSRSEDRTSSSASRIAAIRTFKKWRGRSRAMKNVAPAAKHPQHPCTARTPSGAYVFAERQTTYAVLCIFFRKKLGYLACLPYHTSTEDSTKTVRPASTNLDNPARSSKNPLNLIGQFTVTIVVKSGNRHSGK